MTSAARTLTAPYRLTVTGVRDNRASQNLISPNPSFVDLTGVTPVMPWALAGNWNYATNDQAANPDWKAGTLGPEWLVGAPLNGWRLRTQASFSFYKGSEIARLLFCGMPE